MTLEGLQIVQWGRETTKGTAVVATSKVLMESFEFDPEDLPYRPAYVNGMLLENTGNEFVITRGTRWRARAPLSYEQAMHWLEMMIQGPVTPTGAGPYTWTYTRAAGAIPTLSAFTVERRLNDGTNQIDNEWAYCMADKITLRAAPRGVVMLDAEGFARRIQGSTLTPALSLPTAELIPHGSSQLYLDSTWANRGTTVVAAQLLDWSLECRIGIKPYFTADGRSDLDYPTTVLDRRMVGLSLKATVLIPGTGSQYATEKAAAEAMTLRAAELRFTGTSNRSLKLQMLAKHEKGSLFKTAVRDGQDVAELSMVTSTDQTNYMAGVLINNVSAFA